MKKHTILSTGFILIAATALAQAGVEKVLNSTGGSNKTGHYVFEWSVGETSIAPMQSSTYNLAITNGFLQPLLGKQPNTEQYFAHDEIIILPNPTYNHIEVNIVTSQKGTIQISVVDVTGKLLQSRKVISNGIGSIEKFDLSAYAAGTYLLNFDLSPSLGSIKKKGAYKILKQ